MLVANYEDLVVTLSAVHSNERKRHRAIVVAGHLIVYILKEKCDKLSKEEIQGLLKQSSDRLWDTYKNNRKDTNLSSKEAALQAINSEIEILTTRFNLEAQ